VSLLLYVAFVVMNAFVRPKKDRQPDTDINATSSKIIEPDI